MSVELIIILAYLSLTMFVGFYWGRGVTTVRDYAIGDRNFSTPTLVMSLAATWISGSAVMSGISETYQVGIIDGISYCGSVIGLLGIGYFIAPKMAAFFDMISVGDIMERLYGEKSRIITGFLGFVMSFGFVAGQIKAMGVFFNYFLNLHLSYITIISSLIIIAYSAYGGVKSATFTDIIQFITLAIALPVSLYIILNLTGGYSAMLKSLPASYLALPSEPKVFNKYLFMFFFFMIPSLSPAVTQRMLMAKDIKQIRDSYIGTAIINFFFIIIITLIGLACYSLNPNLEPGESFMYIINTYMPAGVKWIIMIGMIAIVMSTADSHINAGSISFVHDFIVPLYREKIPYKTQLSLLKITTITGGIFAIILALKFTSIINLIFFAYSCYAPLVGVPILIGILGFRTETYSYILAVTTSFSTVIFWEIYPLERWLGYKGLIPSMMISAIALIGSHYLLGLKGGWGASKWTPYLGKIKLN